MGTRASVCSDSIQQWRISLLHNVLKDAKPVKSENLGNNYICY